MRMPDNNNQGLDKLQKLKMEIEKDLEKKTGKKRQSSEKRKKISLSDDLRKRLTTSKSSNVAVDEIRTPIDIERYLTDLSLTDLKGVLRNCTEKDRNIGIQENFKGLLDILNKNLKNADEKFTALVQNVKKDYTFFNFFLTKVLMGKDINKEMKAFYKNYQDSIYPFLLIIFYTVFQTGSYASLKNILRVVEKNDQDLLPELITAMIKHDYMGVSKSIGAIYRQNQFRDYQNIASALPYLLNSDDESHIRVVNTLEKKKHHRCSKIYREYLTKEEINTDKTLSECPMGMFILAKKLLRNGQLQEAKDISKELVRMKDPHGILLQSSMIYASKDEATAFKVWYESLKPYKTIMLGWESESQTQFKGLGLDRGTRSIRLEEFQIPDNIATFKAQIGKRLNQHTDFEIFLYPYEELRALFSPYCCQLYYSIN
ncbi:MAG: hypothetical protein PWQ84_781 [Thermotogaceae bacterium]|nr:hypothetical protein [Thermotogaceae bacterium]